MKQINSNSLRLEFSKALSLMYQQEVPLYAELLHLVDSVNRSNKQANLNNLKQERHGAIRLGKASELFNIRRLFHLMGMQPVAYYDLSTAGLPVHSTAFRPLSTKDIEINPFRIFTSLLRLDLINDLKLKKQTENILEKRDIFNSELLELIGIGELKKSFNEQQFQRFIELAVDIFRWHDESLVSHDLYQQLKSSHPLIADIASFKGPHINHLTPTTVNIDDVQTSMTINNIKAKAVIEGPPLRHCPILLRQTSFTALSENVRFKNNDGSFEQGTHTARFGEIEQRGIALTKKGQHLYEQLIERVKAKRLTSSYEDSLKKSFIDFPDTYDLLRIEELAFFQYSINKSNLKDINLLKTKNIDQLVNCGAVNYEPILYEDFLPVSAAGIFHSNLNDSDQNIETPVGNKDIFEQQLGCDVLDPFKLYKQQQDSSIDACLNYFLSH